MAKPNIKSPMMCRSLSERRQDVDVIPILFLASVTAMRGLAPIQISKRQGAVVSVTSLPSPIGVEVSTFGHQECDLLLSGRMPSLLTSTRR